MLGIARDNIEAALITSGPAGDRPAPQLYTAPDPAEDWEADRAMQNLATLAVQAQKVVATGNTFLNATQVVLNQTRDFFLHGVLPMAGLDELDMFLLKKIGMLSHCGFENDMRITYNNVTDELLCAMRVHLMNESEIHIFCPKEARVWEDNCLDVAFLNYTAISETNEMNVVNALRSSIHNLLTTYPNSIDEDQSILLNIDLTNSDYHSDNDFGPIMSNAILLRYREKQILYNALDFLDVHEEGVKNGSVTYQLEMKARERAESDIRAAEYAKFVEEVKMKAARKQELAFVEVNMGDTKPKVNLTLVEGADIKQTVKAFCQKYGVVGSYEATLEQALRKRVVNPPRLSLMLGVVTPIGDRKILAIPEGANATIETGVFCSKFDNSKDVLTTKWCVELQKRVENRLSATAFHRNVLVAVPIDAPDSRKLQLILREGEQHDLVQFVSDFFDLYSMPRESVYMLAQEVNKRLPGAVLQIPVGLPAQRQVSIRFAPNDNVTNVVEAFVNYFDIHDEQMKIAILKHARHGMAPGTFMV